MQEAITQELEQQYNPEQITERRKKAGHTTIPQKRIYQFVYQNKSNGEKMNKKLVDELKSFEVLWKGGYFGGDPLNPMAKSDYGQLGFMSVLYATYLRCIKPYINNNTVSLEIGPGRGAWTKALLPSKEVYALDALPEEHNQFFKYLGYPKNVKYFQVKDFKCEMLQDSYFDYTFSFGCLCHVSFEGITEYAVNIYPKLKQCGNCFWMVADYNKFNSASLNLNSLSVWNALPRRYQLPLKWLLFLLYRDERKKPPLKADENDPGPGRWYHAGIDKTCSMLEKVGYKVIDADVGTNFRDPIIHFIKP